MFTIQEIHPDDFCRLAEAGEEGEDLLRAEEDGEEGGEERGEEEGEDEEGDIEDVSEDDVFRRNAATTCWTRDTTL